MPDLSGAALWLNSPPLSSKSLKGKVVLIDFWTYSCINCLRTGTVQDHRLYQLIRQKGPVEDRTFEIEFLDPGVQAFAFTFG
jgi:thiol-disulfide isomerase/thioredoxin